MRNRVTQGSILNLLIIYERRFIPMKYKIYGEHDIDPNAIKQMDSAMELDFVIAGALMRDAHFGYSLPIGGVVATDNEVVPAWVGYDIGCGMCAVQTTFSLGEVEFHAEEIFEAIYKHVPVGFKHNDKPCQWREFAEMPKTAFLQKMFWDKGGLKQLGTLGGGNHFIEIGHDEDLHVWIIVHSGSRNVGHSVATQYMKEASYKHTDKFKAKEGHYWFDATSRLGTDYLKDMNLCLAFALKNREYILDRVETAMHSVIGHKDGMLWDTLINKTHNHIEFVGDGFGYIHRKGATQAYEGTEGVIPGNMRDGAFIVRGLGNEESLFSSSHGAGRVLGRKQAKEILDLEVFTSEMDGIVAKVTEGTKDESPMAYKDIFAVMHDQKDLVEIVHHIKPIINVKG
jgi:tRNA-splicing ligase RtcB